MILGFGGFDLGFIFLVSQRPSFLWRGCRISTYNKRVLGLRFPVEESIAFRHSLGGLHVSVKK